MQRRHRKGNEMELQLLLEHADDQMESRPLLQHDKATSYNLTHSANLADKSRFVLLGGDDLAKQEACRFLSRNGQTQQTSDLEWKINESYVQRRHVTVAISPSKWLECLRSSFFLSTGIKRIKNDIKKCVSVVFPGPHAFLLVIRDGRDTGKEHYLIKAVASVFGEEAVDYSMVLIIRGAGAEHSEPASMKCVKKCGKRYHTLEDTDRSVQELFRKVENMVANKKIQFFIPSDFKHFMETDFKKWEMQLKSYTNKLLNQCNNEKEEIKMKWDASQLEVSELNRKLNLIEDKLKKELDASRLRELEQKKELDASHQRERELKFKLEVSERRESDCETKINSSQLKERELHMMLDASQIKVSELKKELDTSKINENILRKELDTSQMREGELKMELTAFQQRESRLRKQLNDYELMDSKQRKHLDAFKSREYKLRKECDDLYKTECELKSKLDASLLRERDLEKKLNVCQLHERELEKKLDASQLDESELQKKLNASQLRENELEKKINVCQLHERELEKKLDASQLQESLLIKELNEFRRHECHPGRVLNPSQQRWSEDRKEDHGTERDNKGQQPQPSRTQERRGSNDFNHPTFSTDQNQYLDTL